MVIARGLQFRDHGDALPIHLSYTATVDVSSSGMPFGPVYGAPGDSRFSRMFLAARNHAAAFAFLGRPPRRPFSRDAEARLRARFIFTEPR
jgi:hypothetical protein